MVVVFSASFLLYVGALLILFQDICRGASSAVGLDFRVRPQFLVSFFSSPSVYVLSLFFSLIAVGVFLVYDGRVRDVVISVSDGGGVDGGDLDVVRRLKQEERRVLGVIVEKGGELYQKDLVDELGLPRYKMTRILHRFERYGLVDIDRQGMSNFVKLCFDPERLEDA